MGHFFFIFESRLTAVRIRNKIFGPFLNQLNDKELQNVCFQFPIGQHQIRPEKYFNILKKILNDIIIQARTL